MRFVIIAILVLILVLLGIGSYLLFQSISAATRPQVTPTPTPTPAPIVIVLGPTTTVTPTPVVVTGTPTPTPTPGPTQITSNNNGQTLTYPATSHFNIILNQQISPRNNSRVACNPQNTLGVIANPVATTPPLYAVSFVGLRPGICTINNNNFAVTINII